ncbi:hypothetical protein [Hahella ganghwensis]|uniref:hypothetical protein n=1 Tax=Hahella ganghwensis TaxID=286420 RepID=UPI0003690B3D|nr:hypothetical protein [Hahella ganghwensis]
MNRSLDEVPASGPLNQLTTEYRRHLKTYRPRFQTYFRQGQSLGARYRLAGRQLKHRLTTSHWEIDQKNSLNLMLLPLETGLLISRHLLAFLEDLLAVGEHRLGLLEAGSDDHRGSLPILSIKASPGEKIESVFLIQNDQAHPVSFELQPQSVLGKESGPCDHCELSFSPQCATLAPGAKQMIRLTTQVGNETVEGIYHTRIDIAGMKNKAFCIQLRVFS